MDKRRFISFCLIGLLLTSGCVSQRGPVDNNLVKIELPATTQPAQKAKWYELLGAFAAGVGVQYVLDHSDNLTFIGVQK